jgi:GNAT superfamily N-acetyltransferase
MGLQIRVGTKADIDVFVEIIQDSFLDVAERFGLTPQNSPTHPSNCRPEWLLREMNRGITFYMLENEGQPVGCVALEKISDEVCYLERLAVPPQERRKGFGEALVKHVLSTSIVWESESSLNIKNCRTGMKSWGLKRWKVKDFLSLFFGLPLWLTIFKGYLLDKRRIGSRCFLGLFDHRGMAAVFENHRFMIPNAFFKKRDT